jgi:hypothetical protein
MSLALCRLSRLDVLCSDGRHCPRSLDSVETSVPIALSHNSSAPAGIRAGSRLWMSALTFYGSIPPR